jgi:hypothetical protein
MHAQPAITTTAAEIMLAAREPRVGTMALIVFHPEEDRLIFNHSPITGDRSPPTFLHFVPL